MNAVQVCQAPFGSRFFSAAHIYEPLHAFAVGILVLALTSLTHANAFLAAFAAGSTMATVGPELREAFQAFGALVTEHSAMPQVQGETCERPESREP